MFTMRVKNDLNDELTLTGNRNFTLLDVEGLNPPQSNISTSKVTNFDGAKINSCSLEVRNIVITVLPEYPVEKNRLEIYKLFRVKHNVTLYFKNGSRNVEIEGKVESCNVNHFSSKQEMQISIICPKSYFIDLNDLIINFSSTIKAFTFPVAFVDVGIPFSYINRTNEYSIINDGDCECGLNIECEFIGDVVELKIYNSLTLDYIQLNYEFHAGDILRINTNKGEKSIILIRNGDEINLINAFDKTSKWLQLPIGVCKFTYNCVYGTNNVLMTLKSNVLYLGV